MTAAELIAMLETLNPETPILVDCDYQGADSIDASDFIVTDDGLVLVV